ncbi:MAG TPA: DUF4910 domain-containing protein [Streptosporangiaceae bacterium]
MADLAAVCAHDRYQASAGIAAAASEVAERAQAAGLAEVTVLSFPADGAERWWTFRAPLPWTPVRARLTVKGVTLVRYPEQPYTLAAYSAPTPPGGRVARLVRWSAVRGGAEAAGGLVVVDEPVALGAVVGPLTAAEAVAVAADPLGGREPRDPGQVGRLELPPGCALAAFSVTAAQLAELAAAADAGDGATVEVVVDDAVRTMPVVTGLLPGTSDDEVLLSAHLCHPRPGANDNASGVAALLGIARVLASREGIVQVQAGREGGGRAGVRFLWGPEFVGVAAYLHDWVHTGRAARPMLAINVDMAGQDVQRCGGPLVIERGPDDVPSFLPALAGRCADLLPPASRSYSGAVPCDPWTWRATPFAGGSDHALLADAPTGCPAIALGHWPDWANHSSADTQDLVDPAELRRTAAIACATAAAVRGRADRELAADVGEATVSWAAGHILATLPGQRQPPSPRQHHEQVLDPRDEANAARWLRHRHGVAASAVAALSAIGADEGWMRSATEWLDSIARAAASRLAPAHDDDPSAGPALERCWTGPVNLRSLAGAADPSDRGWPDGRIVAGRAGPALERCWTGPVNLRSLAGAADPSDRDWLDGRIAADRGGNYARALALMRAVNGKRDRDQVTWWATLSSELPMPVEFASRFLDLMSRAGWTGGGTP